MIQAQREGHTGEVLTVSELAALLKISRTLTYRLIANDEIPSFRIGTRRLIRRVDAENYIRARAERRR